jgi:hypothetical protein
VDSYFTGLALADINGPLIRNIVSLRCSEELFDDLSDDPEDWAIAQQAELNAKPPTYTSPVPIIRRPFEESAWMEAIEFPFRQFTASRYSDGSYGVWYGADTAETSVYETVYHWRYGLLADAGFDGLVRTGKHESITSERKIYRVHCHAALLDLRPRVDRYPELIDPENYGFTQNIGARIHAEGHPGLTTRSARCTGYLCSFQSLCTVQTSHPKLPHLSAQRARSGRLPRRHRAARPLIHHPLKTDSDTCSQVIKFAHG